ncbi:hypothetical protein Tsubulata_048196 [Turnera subulata]|uniref:EF-hand domain-containing protein n=1 Tax=Turnera subulata TaxID=218843 RepID=A0A9Q0G8U0_9ROSI|nr:hypothetical protein Tsubulata_048196 [Turnera subulata]
MAPLNTKDLQRIFQKLDKNGDGLLSLEELNWLLERIGVHISLEELELSVGKSSLNLEEFLSFCDCILTSKQDKEERKKRRSSAHHQDLIEEEEHEEEEEKTMESDLVKAFKVFDTNDDGFISCEELQSVLSRLGLWDEKSGKDCRSMICVFDSNLDGVLDFEEFKNMMLHTSS